MDVTAGERKPRTDGKLMGRPGRAAQNDLGGKNVTSETRQGRNLDPHEFTKRAADVEMMRRDMERYGFHAARLGAVAGTAKTTNRLD